MNYKPYVAIDTETTGLTTNDQILQVGVIVDDLVTPIEALKKVSFLVDNSDRLFTGYLEPEALAMNAWIFEALSGKRSKSHYPVYRHSAAVLALHDILAEVSNKTGSAVVLAGKNVGTFDIPMLRANGFLDEVMLASRKIQISHRTIDIGSLYFPDFGHVPNANEINQLIGRKPVAHDALADALDVVCAIRTKLGIGI